MRTLARCFVLCLFALPSVVLADGMTLEQVAMLSSIGDASMSPDGRHIAYTKSVQREPGVDEDGSAWSELHVAGPDGESRPYITGEVNVGSIGWMPDSRRITFLAKREGDEHRRLYAISIDGGEAQPIATLETSINSYDISPDGRRVALLAFEPEDKDRKREKEKGFDQYVFEEEWTPRKLFMLELNAEDAKPELVELDGSAQGVRWSPAGDRIAVTVTPRELVDDSLMFKRIRIVAPDGRELGRIENPGKLSDFEWSPDGLRLAFIATEIVNDTAAGRLMVTGANGGEWDHLMPGLEGHVRAIGWSDNDTILFISHEGVEARVAAIGHDGANQRTIADLGGPIWNRLSVSDAGDIALVASTPEHPNELFRISASGGTPQRLTDSNPWLSDVDLARQEVVTYTARDGLEIEGLLVYPLDHQRGRRYPLILAVHGGPESHYSDGWLTRYSLPAQPAAMEGYFMFFQNYRGSTGRGVEFALSSQERPSAEEFDDLVDGVDHLIDEGLVDGDRVGITGGSYGGYASAWGATYYSDRFAAAVMFVGISEMFSKLGTSDIPMEMYLVHYRKWPWEDWEFYEKSSPLRYVERAQTPILILHGDEDPRVDPRQSEILYRYLSLQDDPPPVRLVYYKGEGHGNRRAASRYDYSLRMMRWMNHYLKGPGGDPPGPEIDYGLDSEDDNAE